MRGRKLAWAALAALVTTTSAQAAVDPKNPSCPLALNWSTNPTMLFSAREVEGRKVLVGEGAIDDALTPRLVAALDKHKPDEIWLRSPGGNAEVGNAAGREIRKRGIPTRIPASWACFSACNFLFMGGPIRIVEPSGLFIVHMFTHTGDRQLIQDTVRRGDSSTVELIGDVEQSSALLASDDNDFLIRMGVSRKLLTEVMYQQKAVEGARDKSTRRCLTQAELKKYNVSNAS